jgi:uncharacterized protein YbjQ (UPF0145 family)
MTGDSKMMICTMDRVPNRKVETVLGIAYGSCRVQGERAGRWYVPDGKKRWPWAEDPEHHESLFRMAEDVLRENAAAMGAEAVLGVRSQIDRDHGGRPGVTLVGTAVRLSNLPMIQAQQEAPGHLEKAPDAEVPLPKGIVSIAFEGKRGEWEPMAAVDKGCAAGPGPEENESVMALASVLGIPHERATALYKAGLRTVSDVASSNPSDISRICGINPTQARILLESAKRSCSEEKA